MSRTRRRPSAPGSRAEAAELGGPSPLIAYRDVSGAGIDISRAHPGSLPQFITGRSTLLSNLFRDEVGLRTARLAADRITAKNTELRTVRGIDAVHLAVGLATWKIGGVDYAAPMLLRPLAIRRHYADYELKLHGQFFVNPELVRIARDHFGITIDDARLAALAYQNGVFAPQAAIDMLRAATATIDTFSVQPRMVVSTFADVGTAMARDAHDLDHPMLNALAGHVADRERVTAPGQTPSVAGPDDRAPASDNLLLDADAEQEQVLARIAAGHSLTVSTLPGTGGTQTVINAIGELVRAGKRVLVVSPRRSTLDGVRHRLSGIGLDGFAVSPASVRRDLVRAIGRNEKATAPKLAEIDDALLRLRTVLRDYRRALTEKDPALGASVLDATRMLTRLAMLPVPPSTSARLARQALQRLAGDRAHAVESLRQAARLGEFRFGPDDSPWYGVTFASTEEARKVHALAERLHGSTVPSLLEHGYELVAQTRMRPFSTISELGEYLRLLQGIRDSLDRFAPTVFERPLGELIKAHGSRRDTAAMTGPNRRRLRKLAKEYVRPGAHVGDMHEALSRIQAQRTQWQRYVDAGVAPEVPLGLADVSVAWQKVDAELAELDVALGRREPLATLPVARLVRTLAGLAAKSDVFENLIERARIRDELAALGLEPLLIDLSTRHLAEDRVGAELEFAWWQSLLEQALHQNRSLLGANTAVVDRLERDFRLVDEAHAAASGPLLAWQLSGQWRIAIVDEVTEAQNLRHGLTRNRSTATELVTAAPTLMRVLAPVWIASPYQVPDIPDSVDFDTVILVDAAAINLAEATPAIRRARQIVAFGDPVVQKPTPFDVATVPADDRDEETEFDGVSVFERLSELLPVVTLTRSYRAGGEDLAELINDAFYGGEIVSLPWAGSYLGRGSLAVDYVTGGVGHPASGHRGDGEPGRRGRARRHARRRARRASPRRIAHGGHGQPQARRARVRRRVRRVRRSLRRRRLRGSRHAGAVRGADARGGRGGESRPGDLLARLRRHQARQGAQRLRRPVHTGRRPPAHDRHDPGPALDGDRLLDPSLLVRRGTPRARGRDADGDPGRPRRALPRGARRGSGGSAHPRPRPGAAPHRRVRRRRLPGSAAARRAASGQGRRHRAGSGVTSGVAARDPAAAPAGAPAPRLALHPRARASTCTATRPASHVGSAKCSGSPATCRTSTETRSR